MWVFPARPIDPLAAWSAAEQRHCPSGATDVESAVLLVGILYQRWRPRVLVGVSIPWWGVVRVCTQ